MPSTPRSPTRFSLSACCSVRNPVTGKRRLRTRTRQQLPGERFNLGPGGKPEHAKPHVKFSQTPDGKTSIAGTARSMTELRRMTERKLAQLGVPFEAIEAAAKKVEQHAPMLRMELALTPESHRAVAKMACNLFALTYRQMFLDGPFDGVREFVVHGGGTPHDFVVVNTKPVDVTRWGKAIGPLDHLIVVRGDVASHEVHALVALYAHLQFCVRLGAATFTESFATAYRVDQLGRAPRRDDNRDLRCPTQRDFVKIASSLRTARACTRSTRRCAR